jgi:hypothetical protein
MVSRQNGENIALSGLWSYIIGPGIGIGHHSNHIKIFVSLNDHFRANTHLPAVHITYDSVDSYHFEFYNCLSRVSW